MRSVSIFGWHRLSQQILLVKKLRWRPFNCCLGVAHNSTRNDSKQMCSCSRQVFTYSGNHPLTSLLQKETSKSVAVTSAKVLEGELPKELDYFKYAAGGSGKRKADGDGTAAKASKKRKVEDEDEKDSDDSDDEEDADDVEKAPPGIRQRVVTKGANVPAHAETFSALAERYQMSSLLLSNLALHGYDHPTGIQSYGIPILLEVHSPFSCLLLLKSPVSRSCCYFAHRNREDALVSAPNHILARCPLLQCQ